MNGERNVAFNNCGMCFYVPDETVGYVSFMEGTEKVIDHAVALKRYNGASGQGNGQYVQWDDINYRWQFNRLNNHGFNYVERVCEVIN